MRWTSPKLLNELAGYLELGMQGESLAIARVIFKSRSLTPQSFCEAVEAVLIHADHLDRWRRTIEGAYRKLQPLDNADVKVRIFRFYVSVRDWQSALPLLPKPPEIACDYLFSFWVLFELRRFSACEKLIRKFRQFFVELTDPNELEIACFLEAFASFYAFKKRTNKAVELWLQATELETFRENAWDGLISLQATRFYSLLDSADAGIASLTDEFRLTLPGNTGTRRHNCKVRLSRFKRTLGRILPEDELWRFGKSAK